MKVNYKIILINFNSLAILLELVSEKSVVPREPKGQAHSSTCFGLSSTLGKNERKTQTRTHK
jgi:hypothetical protein